MEHVNNKFALALATTTEPLNLEIIGHTEIIIEHY